MTCKKCSCGCHKVVPIVIVLLAADFFLAALGVLTDRFLQLSWPILLGVIGLMKLSKGMCKCCEAPMQK